jgi:hypothetical protein
LTHMQALCGNQRWSRSMRLLQQRKQPALFSQSTKQYEIPSLKALMVRGVLAEGCQGVVEGVEGAEACVDDQQLYAVSIHTMILRCYLCRLLGAYPKEHQTRPDVSRVVGHDKLSCVET